ncbi:MAG TPA: adenylate/guanylate cyclase domain-containing protein [Thermoanaerobaculia bacterium]|nr:adenylate/guanylate cyclase domain-containing protein [Thermoanaerobaculia bacterium]
MERGEEALIVFRPEDLAPAVAMLLALKPDVDAFMEGAGWQCRLTARVHLGPVVAGPFGPRQAKRFDVIGVTVNAGARLASTGVTISRRVYDGLAGDLKARFREGKIDGAFVLRG